jgi:predicted secreted protein
VRTLAISLSVIGIILFAGCKKNHAPDTPAVPSGPTSCAVGVTYTFSSSATDPDGDSVSIRFDWGDGDTSDWSAFVASGDTVTTGHAWAAPGTFSVRVQGKDKDGVTPVWSGGHNLVVCHEWVKTFGGADEDWSLSAQQTLDGEYIFAGYTESFGSGDVWLVKVGAAGDTVWSRTFGGALHDKGKSVQQTSDGGYIIAGGTGSYGAGYYDAWLIKTDAAGDTVWTRAVGGPDMDLGSSVQQTLDGGYIVVGSTWSFGAVCKAYLIKTDASGDTTWTRTFGQVWCEGHSVQQTRDGGYVVGAVDGLSNEVYTIMLIKTDANGYTEWTRTFGGGPVNYVSAEVRQTQDGGYIVASSTVQEAGSGDVLLLKTDSLGEETWRRSFGEDRDDWASSVRQTRDGGYVVAANTSSYGAGGYDFWLIKTDAQGDTAWTRTYGGIDNDRAYSVQQTQDDGFVVIGRTWSRVSNSPDVLMIKTDAEGRVDEGLGK